MSTSNSNNSKAKNGEDTPLNGSKKDKETQGQDDNTGNRILPVANDEDGHKTSGDYLKSIVYGGLDGILTAFAVVTSSAGADLKPQVVLILGISSLFAEAVSMGICDTISTMSYTEHVQHEARREEWEFDNFAEGEISEMVDLYVNRGLPREKAEIVITTMAKYRDFFISVMVLEELELKIPDPNDNAYKDGFVTFASFLLFGSSPIIGYVIVPLFMPSADADLLLGIAFFTTSIALFGLGVFKSGFTAMPWWKSGMEFLFLGSIVALSSYYISAGMSKMLEETAKSSSHSLIENMNNNNNMMEENHDGRLLRFI